MRLTLLLLLASSALAGPDGVLSIEATWRDEGGAAVLAVKGRASLPDGAMIDVEGCLDGATFARAEAIVTDGLFEAAIAAGAVGPGGYVARVRFAPDRQDRRELGALAPAIAEGDATRGTAAQATEARKEAARALTAALDLARRTIYLARNALGAQDPARGVAGAVAGMEAALRLAETSAWPRLPRSRAAFLRLRGWARAAGGLARLEEARAHVAAGERLLAAVGQVLSDEAAGRASPVENAPRPATAEAPDFRVALRAAQDETPNEGIDALGGTLAAGGGELARRLTPLLDLDPVVARRAARCLGWIPDPVAIAALRSRALADDPALRAEVLRSLGRLGDRATAPAIVKALSDPVPAVRTGAVDAVLLLGASDRAPLLFPLCSDVDAEVRLAARDAVRRLAGDWPADLPEETLDGVPEALRVWWIERAGRP